MKRITGLLVSAVLLSLSSFAQKDLSDKLPFDSSDFLRSARNKACECIDSVNTAEKTRTTKLKGFANCIEKETRSYQLSVKLLGALKSSGKNQTITISDNTESREFKKYYYDIERALKDSCAVMNKAIAAYDEPGEKSYTSNEKAAEQYNKGVNLIKQNKYSEALSYFEKAVEIDPEFAFAWDNLGICYRQTGDLEKAETAYKASLKIDPSGKTPLQNLPVIYLIQKRNDEAIGAYDNLLKYYPGDPEVYYGLALLYHNNKGDYEKSLDNMCKAYNIYVEQKSAYRSDAEKFINLIYSEMKEKGMEKTFKRILKDNNISTMQ